MFIDRAKIHIISGKGGDGAVSFRREPFVPEGGPDGGDGGNGGNVIFQADRNYRTLMDFRYKTKYKAENGQDGMKKKKFGKKGEDLIIKVPVGTEIIEAESGKLMVDLVEDGQSFIAAKGGRGGKGNDKYKNSVRQAPNFAQAGGFSVERDVILELKVLADVGLVGFPNVGKSSFLAVTTSAKPKIENYHFTTIAPNLGVVEVHDRSFVLADIAGIIEGAHKGIGLGLRFLKHIERTKVLIHVVDVSGSEGRNPIDDFDKINRELELYNKQVGNKPQIVCANKIDLIGEDSEQYREFKTYVNSKGIEVFPTSAPLKIGIKSVLDSTLKLLDEAIQNPQPEPEIDYFDMSVDDKDPDFKNIYARKEGNKFVLEGKQLKKIFASTNFNDLGSLRYLYKYIEKSGAMDELIAMGLEEGDTIKLFDYEFEYYDEY